MKNPTTIYKFGFVQILAIILIVLMITNFILLIYRVVSVSQFWIITGVCALSGYLMKKYNK